MYPQYWNSLGDLSDNWSNCPIVGLFFAIFMVANIIMKKTKMKAVYIAPPDKPCYETDITCLIISIILIVLGWGALSVDSLICL